ncbi:MAG: hypothetical protein LBU70_00910 [Chitinispirillales bacterium]|jgi:hypothetical protein|nr:hypothetical protein [Chitinispirillales bacterium]
MSLTNEEKGFVEEALSVYLQLVSQQAPPQQVQQLVAIAQGVINKLSHLGAGGADGNTANKPGGISDEWYENVCLSCEMLEAMGCADKVTMKFPGKCDPILHYERAKTVKAG